MSCNYADGLSPYEHKGKLGLAEKFDSKEELVEKVKTLSDWIQSANHVVVHTGAGISTSAGIPDFRGPKGVWTLEAKGEKPDMNISFNDARPTKTHMALLKLLSEGKVKYIVSQNIDGLHMRSGMSRLSLAELHGNMFVEQCNKCSRQFVRSSATSSVGKKCLLKPCPTSQMNGRPCRGRMHDVILDWEHDLPERDLGLADFHSCVADLSICLGTTLQIIPSGNLPLHTKKYGKEGKLVICNLQPTKHDKKADLLIHAYVDEIISLLMENLKIKIPEYTREKDPIYNPRLMEWTIPEFEVKKMRAMYEKTCCKTKKTKVKSYFDDKTDVKKFKKTKSESVEHKTDTNEEENRFQSNGSGDKEPVRKIKTENDSVGAKNSSENRSSDEKSLKNESDIKTEDDVGEVENGSSETLPVDGNKTDETHLPGENNKTDENTQGSELKSNEGRNGNGGKPEDEQITENEIKTEIEEKDDGQVT